MFYFPSDELKKNKKLGMHEKGSIWQDEDVAYKITEDEMACHL